MSDLRANFVVDSHMRVDETLYRVVEQTKQGEYVLENLDNGRHDTWSVEELLKAMQEGRCRPNYPANGSTSKPSADIADPYDTLDEATKRVVQIGRALCRERV